MTQPPYSYAPSPDGSPDRWYYNATLSNPTTGDVSETPARYSELRTVPMMSDTGPYFVCLARMSIIGSTANLPILLPPQLREPQTRAGYMLTDYWVGLRTIFYDDTGTITSGPLGMTDTIVEPLVIPSLYPEEVDTGNPDSKFYWVDSAVQLVGSLNAAIQHMVNRQGVAITSFYPSALPASTPASFSVGSDFEKKMPFYASLDKSSYKICIHGPTDYSTTNLPLGGAYAGNARCIVQLCFSDKLLELFPFDVYSPVPTRGITVYDTPCAPSGVSIVAPVTLTPSSVYFNKSHSVMFTSIVEGQNMFTITTTGGATSIPVSIPSGRYSMAELMAVLNFASNSVGTQYGTQVFTLDTQGRAIANIIGTFTGAGILSAMGFSTSSITGANNVASSPVQTLPFNKTVVMYTLITDRAVGDVVDAVPSPFNRTGTPELLYEQEYEATSAWSVYTGLAITSNMVPAYEESFGVNVVTTENNPANAGNSSSNIIFDVDLSQDQIHQIQAGMTFVPPVFRYAKLRSGVLNGVDLNLYLRTRDGRYVPWMITNGGTVNIKLMFTRDPF